MEEHKITDTSSNSKSNDALEAKPVMDRYAAINARARILSYYLPSPHEEALGKKQEPFERAKAEWIKHAEVALNEVRSMSFNEWQATNSNFKSRRPDECFECGQQYRH